MYQPPDEPLQGSDPYSNPYQQTDQNTQQTPLYGPASIPPPPPGFSADATVPSHFEQLTPTQKATPPSAPAVPKKPKKKGKEISARKAILIYISMPIAAFFLCVIGVTVARALEPVPHTWNTVQSHLGSGSMGEPITVNGTWRISWQCALSKNTTPFAVDVWDNGYTTLIHQHLVDDYCSGSGTSVSLPQNGSFILAVTADPNADWSIDIQQET